MNAAIKPRHEWKYVVSRMEYLAIRQRIRTLMQSDPHAGPDGTYRIRSVYFDDPDDHALWEKLDGVRVREKFRIRWYNDDVSYIALEKKRKVDSLGYKESARLSLSEACAITESREIEWLRDRAETVCRDLYSAMTCRGLRARVAVSYRREPYIYRAGNVRVTFDSEIRTSLFQSGYFAGIRDISATATPHDMLMEVKYDEYLPEIIADLVQPSGLYRQAFSKYAVCRRYG